MIDAVVAPEKERARAASTELAEQASGDATEAGMAESSRTVEAEHSQPRVGMPEDKETPALLIPACGVLCDAFWWARNRK
jgi:hypothetical protein